MYLKRKIHLLSFSFFLSFLAISLSAQPQECFDFSNFEVGQRFGIDSGNRPGDEVPLLLNSDVRVTLESFVYARSETEPGFWNVEVIDWDFSNWDWDGEVPYLGPGNINMVFDFTTLSGDVSQVSFDFVDGGGEHNIRVNGDSLYNVGEFKNLPTAIAPGVTLTIDNNRLFLDGDIQELLIGGQELGFDNFCYIVSDVAPLCIDKVVAKPMPCTPNGIFYTEITFDANNPPSDSFIIQGNGRVYGTFAYGQASYEIGPIEGDSINFEFVVMDALDPNCTNFTEIGPVICEEPPPPCRIFDLWAQTGPCQADGTQALYFNFSKENANPAGFDVFIDQEFANFFRYEDVADSIGYLLSNLDLTAGIHTITICSNDDETCCETIEFDAPGCEVIPNCQLFNLSTSLITCNDDGSYYVEFEFQGVNLNPNFENYEVEVNGNLTDFLPIDATKFKIESTPLTVDGFNRLMVTYKDSMQNCRDALNFEAITCEVDNNCNINNLVVKSSTCDEGLSIVLEFTAELDLPPDASILVKVEDFFSTTLPINPDGTYRIEDLPLPSENYQLTICSVTNPDCCKTTEFFVPECADIATQCQILDVFAEAHPCDSNGLFLVDIAFMAMNQTAAQFEILDMDFNSLGIFNYGEQFYTVGPLRGDGATAYEFIVRDLENTDCFEWGVLPAVDCGTGEGLVWPGDANADNITDNFDLLTVGLAYGLLGPARPFVTDVWEGQAANDWDFSFANGLNGKHADCNGDGAVNENDLDVINKNYGLTHGPVPFKVFSEGEMNAPALYVDLPPLNDIEVGQATKLPIIFGNTELPGNAYGLAFTLKFDPQLIKDGRIEFLESWLGIPEQDLLILHQDFSSDGILEVALTRKDGLIKNGAGVIGNFIVIIDDIEAYTGEGSVDLLNVQVIDNEGNILTIHTPMTQFSTITNTEEVEIAETIKVFPNPVNEYLSIQSDSKEALQEVEIWTIAGEFIQRIPPNQIDNINISELTNGFYLIKINSGKQSIYKKFVKQ